jgi:hypothetical protein
VVRPRGGEDFQTAQRLVNNPMPLIFQRTGNLSGPRLKCDRCAQIIARPGDGLFVWDPRNDDFGQETYELKALILCKECERNREIRKQFPATMEIPTALVCLVVGVGMDKKQWEEAVQIQALLCSLT